MKLISEDILREYGFVENAKIVSKDIIKVFSKDGFDVVIKLDGIFCINLGLNYPLKDTASLKRLYKEVKSKDLIPVK